MLSKKLEQHDYDLIKLKDYKKKLDFKQQR
jgi:hypothetical protein